MQATLNAKSMARVAPASTSAFARGVAVVPRVQTLRAARAELVVKAEKLCLDNLSPQDGARRGKVRRCRGYGGHKGGTGGRGNRGQKSRSGASIRPGFEGGQMPLYRRLPKLKGIAGGMGAGLPDNVVINLADLNAFEEGAEVSLDSLKACRKLNTSGREDKLPLKVLGNGELKVKGLKVCAAKFSESAKAAIEEAGGEAVVVPGRRKWMRKRAGKGKGQGGKGQGAQGESA